MDGHTRRENLRQRLQGAKTPISGAVLAAAFQVSRQVIVQDIALLRAQDVPVISTNRGYLILGEACRVHRFKVRHDLSRMEEELNIFVDAGATVRNVTIDHPVYDLPTTMLSTFWNARVQRRSFPIFSISLPPRSMSRTSSTPTLERGGLLRPAPSSAFRHFSTCAAPRSKR